MDDLDKPYLWRVFKRDERADAVFVGPVWCELGTVPGKYGFSPPTAQELGDAIDLISPGAFMLICNDHVEHVTLEATFRYAAEREEALA